MPSATLQLVSGGGVVSIRYSEVAPGSLMLPRNPREASGAGGLGLQRPTAVTGFTHPGATIC